MGVLLPLQNCNYTVYDPKPDLLLPVCQFLFVGVYCVPVVMQTARVIDVLQFPVNEPLEELIHPLRALSTVYASLKKQHTPLFNTITCTYGSFRHGVMGQLHGLFQFSSRSGRCTSSHFSRRGHQQSSFNATASYECRQSTHRVEPPISYPSSTVRQRVPRPRRPKKLPASHVVPRAVWIPLHPKSNQRSECIARVLYHRTFCFPLQDGVFHPHS